MKTKALLFILALTCAPFSVQAQTQFNSYSYSSDSYYQTWLADYEATGNAINEVSEVYQQEVDKRGYPKKKTVKKKIALIEHYVELLTTQLTDSRLNKDLDRGKVERKINEWNEQLSELQMLLKKI